MPDTSQRYERLRRRHEAMLAWAPIQPDERYDWGLSEIHRMEKQDLAGSSSTDDDRALDSMREAARAQLPDGYDGKPLQPVVDLLVDGVRDATARIGRRLPDDFYAGTFPTGDYNAIAVATPDGPLVLLNLGLMMTLHKLSKLLWHDLFAQAPGLEHAVVPVRKMAPRSWPTVTPERLALLRRIFTAYLPGGSGRAPRVPVLGGRAGLLSGTLVSVAETFVLGHEAGHVLLGHLDAARMVEKALPQTARKVLVHQPHHAQEFAADAYSVRLLLAGSAPIRISADITQSPIQELLCTGVRFFFAAAEMFVILSQVWSGASTPQLSTTHPPADERMRRIETLLAERGIPTRGPTSNMLATWIDVITVRVAEEGPLPTPSGTFYRW